MWTTSRIWLSTSRVGSFAREGLEALLECYHVCEDGRLVVGRYIKLLRLWVSWVKLANLLSLDVYAARLGSRMEIRSGE